MARAYSKQSVELGFKPRESSSRVKTEEVFGSGPRRYSRDTCGLETRQNRDCSKGYNRGELLSCLYCVGPLLADFVHVQILPNALGKSPKYY